MVDLDRKIDSGLEAVLVASCSKPPCLPFERLWCAVNCEDGFKVCLFVDEKAALHLTDWIVGILRKPPKDNDSLLHTTRLGSTPDRLAVDMDRMGLDTNGKVKNE